MLIEHVLPPHAVGEDALGDPPPTAPTGLFPEEERAIAYAGDKRRREFITARQCAHRALARLGLPPAPLLPGPTGAPAWPPGITGSITHCDGYRAAAVTRTTDLPHLGIDAEPHAPLPPTVREGIATPTERHHLQHLTATHPDIAWDRLLFSAKESVYKTYAPLSPRPLDFDDAEITFAPTTHTFTARLQLPHHPTLFGNWHTTPTLLLTSASLPTP
ncbi:4'-phosphopantetheinyl transferase [Streptomyces sp. NPDC056149]|uniref:4'-phosphopantetheinyl transferase family protein n=1 Tax=Streptomyces sp. NPDC056149 TaxID=3345728 RepID=UPI0035DF0D16